MADLDGPDRDGSRPDGSVLDDPVLLVSGAASGIGRATLRLWRQRGGQGLGFDIAAPQTGSGSTDGTSDQADDQTNLLVGDVTREDDVRRAVESTVERFGRLTAVFHSAGLLGQPAPVTAVSLDDWSRIMDVHVTGAFLLAKHAIPYLAQSGGGTIVFTGSIVAEEGSPAHAAYAAAKAAVVSLARSIAAGVGRARIRVNVVSPGSVLETNLTRASRGYGITVPELARLVAHIPLGRAAQPRDIAEAVCFLASPAARHITGANLVIDGGEHFPRVLNDPVRTTTVAGGPDRVPGR